ncbi:MAG: GNAT family N-acetyltransferase [Caulobacteraceae bacterium]|nr:GNAT family N-acetyltransferase [Caulobacteraceae bacterium]
MISIRRATPADADALHRIGRETFAETFGRLYPQDDLDAFLDEAYAIDKCADELAGTDEAVWLAERDGQVVGYAQAGRCKLPHAEVTPACGELKRLYVRAGEQGSGLGRRLLAEALAWLERPGRRLWIGVWAENHGAQRLYARHGFAKAGEYQFPVGRVRDREFILLREAEEPVSAA